MDKPNLIPLLSRNLIRSPQRPFERLIWLIPISVVTGASLLLLLTAVGTSAAAFLPSLMTNAIGPAFILMPFALATLAALLTARHTSTPHYEMITQTRISNFHIAYGFYGAILRRLKVYLIVPIALIPALGYSLAYTGERSEHSVNSASVFYAILLLIYWGFYWFGIAVGMACGMRWRTGFTAGMLAPFAVLLGMIGGSCALLCGFLSFVSQLNLEASIADSSVEVILLGIVACAFPIILTMTTISLAESAVRFQQD